MKGISSITSDYVKKFGIIVRKEKVKLKINKKHI